MIGWIYETLVRFSLLTMLPTFLIFYLPNVWYWIILKILCGFVAFSTMHGLLFRQWCEVNLGVAKAGFVMNSILIAVMLLVDNIYLYIIFSIVIIASYPFMKQMIVEAQLSNRGNEWKNANIE